MGGSLVVRPDETVCATLRAGGVPGSRVTLHTDLGVVHEAVIAQPVAAVLWETVSDATRFVRAEVRGPRGEMIALSNPVWIETAAGGADPDILTGRPELLVVLDAAAEVARAHRPPPHRGGGRSSSPEVAVARPSSSASTPAQRS